jgi:selenocysteine lyase/cysteine desulfurase
VTRIRTFSLTDGSDQNGGGLQRAVASGVTVLGSERNMERYFDNAATTFPKPEETIQAMEWALRTIGNAGRGAHETTLAADRVVFRVREQLAELFHAEDSSRIAFTQNTTQALNTAILGLFSPGDHVVTTACEHNSVLRPLYHLRESGLELTIVPADRQGRIDYEAMEQSIRPETKAIVVTHASNVSGNVTDLAYVSDLAGRNNLLLIVDAAQSVGTIPIDVQRDKIDVLCFPGHKGLLGPQGTGGIYVRPGLHVRPLMTGGSGVHSFRHRHPEEMPVALEAGTLNAHGIAGLGGGLAFLERVGIDTIRKKEDALARRFFEGVCGIPGVTLYGDFSSYESYVPHKEKNSRNAAMPHLSAADSSEEKSEGCAQQRETAACSLRVAVISLNIGSYDSGEIADALMEGYRISVRAGAHCAPLMHEALGTKERGVVRFSFSCFQEEEDIDAAIRAVRELAEA